MSMQHRAAVIGTGFIGPVHVEALRRVGVPVIGVLGSSADRSQAAARQLQIPRAYRDAAELLADPDVDVVHIASPNAVHYVQAKAALLAGKHVFCEKPLALRSSESAELLKLAQSRNLRHAVAYNIRFYPLNLEVHRRIRDGLAGRLFSVNGAYVQDWLQFASDYNWRVESESAGTLRAVADIGTHWMDLVQFITGKKITSVSARLHTVHPRRVKPVGGRQTFEGKETTSGETVPVDTEDCGSVQLQFEDGSLGALWVSQTTAGRKNCLRYEIALAERSMAWNSERPNEMWLGRREGPSEVLLKDPSLLHPDVSSAAQFPGGHNEGFADTFRAMFSEFYASLADNSAAPHVADFADGHREVLVCEGILQSHKTGQWIEIELPNS